MNIKIKYLTVIILTIFFYGCVSQSKDKEEYLISLAEWSLHRNLQDSSIDHLDVARIAVDSFNISAIEYVSQFFQNKAQDFSYLQQMKDSCSKYHVQNLLIMVDGEGNLGDTAENLRILSVEDHKKWIDAALFLECNAIRVNGCGLGTMDMVQQALIKSLDELSAYASDKNIQILVENHGMIMPDGSWNYYSHATNGKWLAETIKKVNKPNIGTLPDFGNFVEYDRYQGLEDLIPFAGGISAKGIQFDELGEETQTDYSKMFQIIHKHKFNGYIGIEFEGDVDENFTEFDGVRKVFNLIRKYY
ncbi:MAG: TIM barrel protein [Bacteroidales bacterium]|nr:TIM barrel protein [Bacteroidales bacterium]